MKNLIMDMTQSFKDAASAKFSENKKHVEICFIGGGCNMNCEYCFGNQKTRPRTELSPLNKEELKKQLLPFKEKITDISVWCGELLFNKEAFYEVVSFLKENFPDTQILIASNGILLPEFTDFLIENHIGIVLSHDGPGQRYRGFDFLESAKHVECIKKLYQQGLFSTFKTVVHSKNHSLEAIHKYFSDFREKTGILAGFDWMIIHPNERSLFCFKSQEDLNNLSQSGAWIARAIITHSQDKEYLKYIHNKEIFFKIESVLKYLVTGGSTSSQVKTCSGQNSLAFTSSGKRLPCHCFSEPSKFDENITVNPNEVLKKCFNCKLNFICGGGCVAKTGPERDLLCKELYAYSEAILEVLTNMYDKSVNKEANNE